VGFNGGRLAYTGTPATAESTNTHPQTIAGRLFIMMAAKKGRRGCRSSEDAAPPCSPALSGANIRYETGPSAVIYTHPVILHLPKGLSPPTHAALMPSFFFWSAIGFVVGFAYASFVEWSLHRFVMHKPIRWLTYPFRAHAQIHHQVFKADHTYHLQDEKHKDIIPMAWWNGPVIITLGSLPIGLPALIFGLWPLTIGIIIALGAYYGAYEYMHWCMHYPKARNVERSGIFFRLNGHHLLHHRYMHKNFNVVFPLADLLCGTLLLRSKIRFAQAESPALPNVQPREAVLA